MHVENAGTHVSSLDWRCPNVWSTSDDQIQTVSQSVKELVFILDDSFNSYRTLAIPKCILRGIVEPRAPSFFGTLVQSAIHPIVRPAQ